MLVHLKRVLRKGEDQRAEVIRSVDGILEGEIGLNHVIEEPVNSAFRQTHFFTYVRESMGSCRKAFKDFSDLPKGLAHRENPNPDCSKIRNFYSKIQNSAAWQFPSRKKFWG
jgi:hypothetical protein